MTKSNTLPSDQTAAFKDLVNAMALITEASNRLGKLENELQEEYIGLVDARRKEYTFLQSTISKGEQAAEAIALMNPQWFETVKTVTTPYGSVKSRTTTKLEVANADVSIALLQQLGLESAPFLRVETTLNLEALEGLTDDELARVRIKRVTKENITTKPATVDLGKAVKAADVKAAKANTKSVKATAA